MAGVVTEVYPLLWTNDVARLADWGIAVLGLTESWRAPGKDGQIEHAELLWGDGKISLNLKKEDNTGPAGIALRVDNRDEVDRIHTRVQAAGGHISQPLAESLVAYSFTVTDDDGNQWWVNAETGFLDDLRKQDPGGA